MLTGARCFIVVYCSSDAVCTDLQGDDVLSARSTVQLLLPLVGRLGQLRVHGGEEVQRRPEGVLVRIIAVSCRTGRSTAVAAPPR